MLKRLILSLLLLSVLSLNAKADLIVSFTGDGNVGSVWTLSGTGESNGNNVSSVSFNFTAGLLEDAANSGAGSMQVGGIAVTGISVAGNRLSFSFASPLSNKTDLTTASGSFVNNSVVFTGGLAGNVTSTNGPNVGNLTFQAVPEPAALLCLSSFLPVALFRRRRE